MKTIFFAIVLFISFLPSFVMTTNNDIPDDLLVIVKQTEHVLESNDILGLAKLVHPKFGLLISLDEIMNSIEDPIFGARILPLLLEDSTAYVWGYYDGSSHLEMRTFRDVSKYFLGKDLSSFEVISFNKRVSGGNNRLILPEHCINPVFIEYYNPGDGGERSWWSRYLVFDKMESDSKWYLVALAIGHWSI